MVEEKTGFNLKQLHSKTLKGLQSEVQSINRVALSVDCVIFGFDENKLKVLLIRSDLKKYQNQFSLLGDLVKPEEDLDTSAYRILKQRTGLNDLYLEQVHTKLCPRLSSMKFPYLAKLFSLLLFFMQFTIVNAQNISGGELYKSKNFTLSNSFTHGVEGPAVDKYGNVYAVNFEHEGTIGMVTPSGEASVFIELPKGSVGNGIRFDSHGNMLIADYKMHNVLKVDMKNKSITVYAHESRMTQPNDLAIDSKDRVYASDPDFKAQTGRVWRVDTNGEVTLLDSMPAAANGIEVSPDETKLYVGAGRDVFSYDLSSNGELSNKKLLIEFPDFGTDGMRCDAKGNLYVARFGKGVIAKVSPTGELLREIELNGKRPTNVAFGGKDGCTVYVTLMDMGNLESFRVDIPGRLWKMKKGW